MGDEPSEVDCAIFGMLAFVYWLLPGSPLEKYMKGLCLVVTLVFVCSWFLLAVCLCSWFCLKISVHGFTLWFLFAVRLCS